MLEDYLIIQQRINYYSSYVKHLIVGLCEEFQTNKIHSKHITSVLERLFATESNVFLNFFIDEKFRMPTQFMRYLNEQGEIIHLGKNYYTLPPERSIKLPDGQFVSISSLQVENNSLGIGQLALNKFPISLNFDEFVFMPTFEMVLKYYIAKLSNHHDIIPVDLIYFNERGAFQKTSIKNLQDGEFYIARFERMIGSNKKTEKYFAQWKNNEWFVTEIINGMYTRVQRALRDRKNNHSTYKIIRHERDFIEINLPYSLPKEEEILLRLIATPQKNKWSKSYVTKENQLHNVQAILANCKLIEEAVIKDGLYN